MYYLEQIAEGAWLKALLATATVFLLELLHLDLHVLFIYLAFAFADLYLGCRIARKTGLYDRRKLKFWARKQLTHLSVALLIGILGYATTRVSEYGSTAINWALLLLIYVEAASVEEKLKTLGWPIHPVLHAIFALMRKKSARDFSILLADPEARKELEAALSSKECREPGQERL